MRIDNRLKMALLVIVLLVGLELAPGVLAQSPDEYQPPHDRPGPASERIQFQSFHVDLAGQSLQNGDMDFYLFSLKTEAARQLQDSTDITMYQAPATSISLILNPAPAIEGELNPFSIREVRQALQYAVDRRFIAEEIYKGLAEPMLAHVGPFDYDYLTVYDELKGQDITYDPEFSRDLVEQAMTGAGATLQDDKWHYNDRPVQVKFIIRVEDERREVGDLIRAELDKLGFTVVPTYLNFAPAILSVYGTDPQVFQWHLYTEGWGRGAAERFDYGTANSMTAPWLGNMPGWQEVGFWQYENERLDELGQNLFQGNFRSVEERNEIYQEITDISLQESVRVWLATIVNSLPTDNNLQGVTQDISAGPKSIWTLREAHIPGSDTLTVGNLWVWTERTTWNPVGGFGDLYSVDIWNNVHDPPLWRDPFTGVPIPFRAEYEVTTAGPEGKLDVPSDAKLWDAANDEFVSVGDGVQATSKVIFDYSKFFQSKWHHGQPITMADVVYTISQGFDRALDEDKSKIEFALAVTSKPFLETVRGVKVLDENRLEVYVDYWHFVEDYIAEYANMSGVSMPWEVIAALDKLVFEDRRAAYSDTAAQRFSVPWINLVMPNDVRLLRRSLIELRSDNQYPESIFQSSGVSVSEEEASQRYQAVLDWIEEYDLAIISNGPFQLVRYDPPSQFAELLAFRDPSYPFKPGDWYKGAPPAIRFNNIEAPGISIGSAASVEVTLEGPGLIDLRYLLLDPVSGEVVTLGDAQRTSGNQYSLEIPGGVTGQLSDGLYQLFLVASSDLVSSLAERRVDLEAFSGEIPTQATVVSTPTAAAPTATPSEGGGGFSCSGPPLQSG